jgi:hypothetical protein
LATAKPLRGVLFCFDTDGTLETSAGPVTVATLEHLKQLGGAVVIVSPSLARPPGWLVCVPGPNRRDNLLAAREMFPDRPLRLYVSDNNDQGEAELAGFSYIDRLAFRLA